MSFDTKRTIYFGLTGVLAGIVIIASVFSSPLIISYIFSSPMAETGTLVLKVTDAPVPDLKNLNLTIDSVEIQNESGEWTTLTIIGGEAYFDLLRLENVTMDLAIDEIPVGNYTKIRMQIVAANATLDDNSTITLNVPSGHVDIHVRFEIEPEKTTSLIIDIIVDRVRIAERGKSGKPANLKPQFKTILIPP